MGLPAGWVTGKEIGLKRNDALKACGNGVVPQQAELALRILLENVNLEGETNV
jgi:DNA (cytosine-5)-methyltransferase 1